MNFGDLLVIIGTCLAALDAILGFRPAPAAHPARVYYLLHVGVVLIGIGIGSTSRPAIWQSTPF